MHGVCTRLLSSYCLWSHSPILLQRGKFESLKIIFPRLSCEQGPGGNPKAGERGVLLWIWEWGGCWGHCRDGGPDCGSPDEGSIISAVPDWSRQHPFGKPRTDQQHSSRCGLRGLDQGCLLMASPSFLQLTPPHLLLFYHFQPFCNPFPVLKFPKFETPRVVSILLPGSRSILFKNQNEGEERKVFCWERLPWAKVQSWKSLEELLENTK